MGGILKKGCFLLTIQTSVLNTDKFFSSGSAISTDSHHFPFYSQCGEHISGSSVLVRKDK